MKKIIAMLVAGLAFGAMAAVEKIAVLEIADINRLVKAAVKAGELVGQPMLGTMASGSLAMNPYLEVFGPMRDGSSAYLVVYADAEKKLDELEPDFAIVWPVTRSKTTFVASNPGCKEQDGVIAVPEVDDDDDDEEKEDSEPEYSYTAFSPDGKWAAKSESAEFALKSLEVVAASSLQTDEVVRASITPAGMKLICKALEKQFEEDCGNVDANKNLLKFLQMMSEIEAGVGIGDAGLTLSAVVTPVAGSVLAASGTKTFECCPFASLKTGAFFAGATQAGVIAAGNIDNYDKLLKILNKAGVKTEFLKVSSDEGTVEWTLDIPAFVKYLKADKDNEIDQKAIKESIEKLQAETSDEWTKVSDKPYKVSFSLEGVAAPVPPGELFKSIMPEAAGKKPYSVSVGSFAALAIELAPVIVEDLPAERRDAIKPLLATLPKPCKGGVASASWREGDKFVGKFRVSAEEIKAIAAVVNVVMACGIAM